MYAKYWVQYYRKVKKPLDRLKETLKNERINCLIQGVPKKHGNSVTNSILSTTLGHKDISISNIYIFDILEIRKSDFVAKTQLL